MAMTNIGMKNALISAIQSLDEEDRNFDAVWEKIAEAIVTYIKANAVVTGPVTVVSVTGVTPGILTSGPGTGNLTAGTIA